MTADEVGRAARAEVDSFFATATEGDQWLIKASLGCGKSRAAMDATAAHLIAQPDDRVLIRVPNHKLAAETEAALIERGVSVGVWRGTDAADPTAEGETMCRRAGDDLKAVRAAGGSHLALCGKPNKADADLADDDMPSAEGKGCALCAFYPTGENRPEKWCGYRQQDLREASVVIVAHDVSITRALPDRIRRRMVRVEGSGGKITYERDPRPDFNFVILDETSASDLLAGADSEPIKVSVLRAPLEQLADQAGHAPTDGGDAIDRQIARRNRATADATRWALAEVLDRVTAEGRWACAADFQAAGVTLEDVRVLRKAIWKWMPSITTLDGLVNLGGADIALSLAPKAALARVVRMISRWAGALAQGLEDAEQSGDFDQPIAQAELASPTGDDGSQYHTGQILTRAEIADSLAQRPILILDATPEIDLLRAWFPALELKADLRAKDGEGAHNIQIYDSHFAYGAIVPKPHTKDYGRQTKNCGRALNLGMLFKAQLGGDVAALMPKGSEESLKKDLPKAAAQLDLGHYGNLRGSNAFEGARTLITLGRPAPSVRVAERMAAVIAGRRVQQIEPDERGRVMYAQRETAILMRDGTGRGVVNEFHPDPIVEAVRRSVTEDELDQAQGRGRAVRRGVDNPLVSFRLSDVASDQPIDYAMSSAEFKTLGGFAGLALGAGVWPIGMGRSWLFQKSLGAFWREKGVDQADLPDRWLADLIGSTDDKAASQMVCRAVDRHPTLAAFFKKLDDAFAEDGDRSAMICGVPFDLSGWHRFTVHSDRHRTASVMLKGATVAEAASLGESLFSGCVITPDLAAEPEARPSAEQLAIERVKEAIARHGVLIKSPRGAARYMPEVWSSEQLARQSLATFEKVRRGVREIVLPPIGTHIGTGRISDGSRRTFFSDQAEAKSAFDVTFKPRSCPQWPRPRRTSATVFADTEAEAKRKVETLVRDLLGDDLGVGFKLVPLEAFEVVDVRNLHATPAPVPKAALGAFATPDSIKRLIRRQASLASYARMIAKPPDSLAQFAVPPAAFVVPRPPDVPAPQHY